MTSRDFCYWLQGFFELREPGGFMQITSDQAKMIEKHLALVFKHEIDPSMGKQNHQDALDEIHNQQAQGGLATGLVQRC